MQSCYIGQGARVVNTRRNGILINFPVVRRGECLVSDTRQAVGSRQGGLYSSTGHIGVWQLPASSNKSYHLMTK